MGGGNSKPAKKRSSKSGPAGRRASQQQQQQRRKSSSASSLTLPAEYASPDSIAPQTTAKPVAAALPPPVVHPKPSKGNNNSGSGSSSGGNGGGGSGGSGGRVAPPVAPKPNKFQTQNVDLGWIMSKSIAAAVDNTPNSDAQSTTSSTATSLSKQASVSSQDSAKVNSKHQQSNSSATMPINAKRASNASEHVPPASPSPSTQSVVNKSATAKTPISATSGVDHAEATEQVAMHRPATHSVDLSRSIAAAAASVAKASVSLSATTKDDSEAAPGWSSYTPTPAGPVAVAAAQVPVVAASRSSAESNHGKSRSSVVMINAVSTSPPTSSSPAPQVNHQPSASLGGSSSSSPAPELTFDELKTDKSLMTSPKKDLARLQKGRKRPPSKATRVYLDDETYKAIPLSTTATTKEIVTEMIEKTHLEDKEASYYRLFEVDADSCAQRELAGNELPLAVILGWPEEIKPNMRLYFKHKVKSIPRKVGKNTLKRQKAVQPLLVNRVAYKGMVALPDERSLEFAITNDMTASDVLDIVAKSINLKSKDNWKLCEIQGSERPKAIPESSAVFDIMLNWQGRADCRFALVPASSS